MAGAGKTGDGEDRRSETMVRFVATVIVSTMMAAITAWALSYAMLTPERVGATHGAAGSLQRARS
ncbi:hypothetical protein DFR50_13424 [Roseiarcus fermentans]|uniref:Uncharacterized protein n=1 Tax=Roseiarcus fermentans TaxID=1473586 RepID=A0A366ETE9_9HYPH|nr:hypothetical protein [Roseiarcus fermentans]RBP05661.1 hypothetical protein DFR50_13424 [Roseiarcus fermentans]